MQKVLCVSTLENSMRSQIQSWDYEDGNAVTEAFLNRFGTNGEYSHPSDMPVGLIGNSKIILHPTVLHALGSGWKLLAPPESYDLIIDDTIRQMWQWWLVKD
jgi:hypothetical protein